MRQAIVIIHGIGEQWPMDTLRGFVGAIADHKVRSKPDRLSESFELRRFNLVPNRADHLPSTDVYELYWAHHMREGRWSATLAWICRLLFRRSSRVPVGLRAWHAAIWISIGAVVALLAASLARAVHSDAHALRAFATSFVTWSGFALFAIELLLGPIVLRYIADAARYLTPAPDNIEARSKLRAEGVRLLRRLHKEGTYARVVVVGHSLGSVIGYDVLRHLWDELRMPAFDEPRPQPLAADFELRIKDLYARNANPEARAAAVEAFQQAQHQLWREHRAVGVPWLVTDFVTLGSPLAHAELLLASKSVSLSQRKLERELPTCPPTSGEDEAHYTEYHEFRTALGHTVKWTFRIPHHGAGFSSTRWTNLYFPHRRLLLGDLIGGPLAPVFGPGIRDVALRPSLCGWLARTLYSHVLYWRRPDEAQQETAPKSAVEARVARKQRDRQSGTKDALLALRAALQLAADRSREPWPPASGAAPRAGPQPAPLPKEIGPQPPAPAEPPPPTPAATPTPPQPPHPHNGGQCAGRTSAER